MKIYSNDMTLENALQVYFSKYHFQNGGYDLTWFKIKLGPVYIPLPNTKARVAAVKIHDIHHLITEYEANLKGEAEISGWELASGCGKYYAAWILNSGSFFYGMFFFPRALFRAFMRGRKARTNFYYNTTYNSDFLNRSLGDMRKIAEPDGEQGESTTSDYLYFFFWCLSILTLSVLFLTALCILFFALFR
jgi:hypothetical protein